jgi:hypothetical protein
MADTGLAIYVAEQILAFRQKVKGADPAFFEQPENQAAFQTFVQSLPYVWVGQQSGRSSLLPLPTNGGALQ